MIYIIFLISIILLIFCFSVYFKMIDNYILKKENVNFDNDLKKINTKYKSKFLTNHFTNVFNIIGNIIKEKINQKYIIKKENYGILMIFLMPIIAFTSYNFVGKPSYQDTSVLELQQNGLANNNLSNEDMKEFVLSMVERLKTRLEDDPEQDEGLWLKLSNSYLKLNDFESLKWSSKMWYENFKNPNALLLHIRTLRHLNQNKNNNEIVKYMRELYEIQPENTENSILLGIWEYKNNDKKYGEKLIKKTLDKLNPKDKKQLEETINNLIK